MELAVSKAKRAGWRGDYPIGAVITRNAGRREWSLRTPVTAQKLADQASKHVELETLIVFHSTKKANVR
jgi:tRNA(Arg) A34 adenosine deaminase TadA